MLQDVTEISLVEALGGRLLLGHVLQQRVENLQAGVSHIPHSVLEGPYDGVQHQFELGGRDGEECGETVGVYSLEQVEKVGPVLRILFKVLVEKQQRFPTLDRVKRSTPQHARTSGTQLVSKNILNSCSPKMST